MKAGWCRQTALKLHFRAYPAVACAASCREAGKDPLFRFARMMLQSQAQSQESSRFAPWP